jgi:HPt (histidine-containing phosphotransfer) domain-containing protein
MSGVPSSTDGEQEMRQQVKALAERFLKRTIDQVSSLRAELTRVSTGDTAALQAIQDVAHKIHGSGAVFGFPRTSDCAEELERATDQMIKTVADGTAAPPTEYAQQLSAHMEQLAAALEAESRLFWDK